jgi:hypothetical protein
MSNKDILAFILSHVGRIIIGVILGTFSAGLILSVVLRPTITVALISGLIGVLVYYVYLFKKNKV